jgi:TolB-like protein
MPKAPQQFTPSPRAQPTDLIKTSYGAADALISQINKTLSPEESAFITATLVNINRLDESSPLGRLISEHLSARFTQTGYRIVETKLRTQIYLKRDTGELALSREIREIAKKHSVRAIISGTYTESLNRVFVSLKIIEIEKNVVMAAFDYVLEKDALVKSLLNPT